MKNMKKTVAFITALGALLMTSCSKQTIDDFTEYFDANDFSAALEYYCDELDGDLEREADDYIEDELDEDRIEEIVSLYWEDEITAEQIEDLFELLDEADIDEEDYEDLTDAAYAVEMSRENYSIAMEYLDDEDYSLAAEYFAMVDQRDVYYEEACDQIDEIEYLEAIEQLDAVEYYIKDKDYYNAFSYISSYADRYSSNDAISEKVEDLSDMLLNAIIDEIDKYIASDDFDDAEDLVDTALYYYPSDSELNKKYDEIESARDDYANQQVENAITDVIEEASDYADSGNWEMAVEILTQAQDDYPDNERILQSYDEITAKMPITLKNISTVSSNSLTVHKDVVTNTWGYHYDGAVSFDCYYGDGYALYNLDGKFTTFKATAWVSGDNGRNMSISIYLDEELIYFSEGISEETAPFEISLDVTNKKTMKIVACESNRYDYSNLYLADSSFAKAGEAQQPAADESASSAE